MNKKHTMQSGSHSGILRYLFLLAAMLMAVGVISGRSVRVYAAGEIVSDFNLPFSDNWTGGATTSKKDIHYYRIDLPRPSLLTVEIVNMASGQVFRLYDEYKSSNLGQITSGNDNGIWLYNIESYNGSRSWYLEKGTYYLKICPYSDGGHYGNYKVRASFYDAGSSEPEPNNDATQAAPLTYDKEIKGLISIQDRQEWFSFTVEQSGTIGFLFREYFSGVDWQLHTSDQKGFTGGTDYGGSLTNPKTHYIKRDLTAGDYYFRISTISGDPRYGYYDLMVFRPVTNIALECPDTLVVGEDPTPVYATVTPSNASFPELKWSTSDASVAAVSDEGFVTPKAPGTATITAAAADGINTSASVKITVVKPELELEKNKFTIKVGKTAQINITKLVPEGNVGFASSDLNVAKVNSSGKITAVGAGKCRITVWKGKISRTVYVTVKRYTQKIKGPKSSYTMAVGDDPFRLNAKTTGDGYLTYASSNRKVVTVSDAGRVNPVGIGTATVTIIASQTTKYAKTTKAVTFTVRPKAVEFKSLENRKGGKLKITWKKVAGVDGYEIEYSTNSKFKNKKSADVGSAKTTSRTLEGLTKGKKYYVRIRAYKDASDGKTYNSVWTKTSVKIKR